MIVDLDIDNLLIDNGFDTLRSRSDARRTLEGAGLTNPRKSRIRASKREVAERLLRDTTFRVCDSPECRRMAPKLAPGKAVVSVTPSSCQVCGASPNRLAVVKLDWLLRTRGAQDVIIVGGTPVEHREISALTTDSPVRYRLVDATARNYAKRDVRAQVRRADLVIVWGSTPLPHKVSNLYTDLAPSDRVIRATRRGISHMCLEVIQSLGQVG